jgi:hypothetical protein
MKKILGTTILLLMVFGLTTNVYAEDTEVMDENLGKYGLTEESIKIKLTMLESTIDLKITHTEYAITKINEEDSTIDTSVLSDEIVILEEIMQRVDDAINNTELTREQLLEVFYTEKENSRESISNIRNFLAAIPEEIRTPLSEQYRTERHQIRNEYRTKMSELRVAHNNKVRQNYRNIYDELKEKHGQNRSQLNQEFKQKAGENRQQRAIDGQLIRDRVRQNRLLGDQNGQARGNQNGNGYGQGNQNGEQ